MKIVVEGLAPLRERFAAFPAKYKSAERDALNASLLAIHEAVPSYPPPPPGSKYIRTGTLGRSLGANFQGEIIGNADIQEITQGARVAEASFGTRLYYARSVIGEGTQKPVHEGRWWTLDGTVLRKAAPKIEKLWRAMAEGLALWLDGRK